MELDLEDLFAEPPPKIENDILDHELPSLGPRVSEIIKIDLKRQLETEQDASNEVFKRSKCSSNHESFSSESNISRLETRHMDTCSDGIDVSSNVSQFNVKKDKNSPRQYHIPDLGEVLKSAASVCSSTNVETLSVIKNFIKENKTKVTSERFHEHCNSKVPPMEEGQSVNQCFRELFRKKSVDRSENNEARNEGKTFTGSKQVTFIKRLEKSPHSTSFPMTEKADKTFSHIETSSLKKKKAGNYLRKLHTKCRVSAKEIRKVELKNGSKEMDFFGEISDRPLILEDISDLHQTETCCPAKQDEACSQYLKNSVETILKKNDKQRAKKRRKDKKRKESALKRKESSKCDKSDDEDIILMPRKCVKPHKWPIRIKEGKLATPKETQTKYDDVGMNKIDKKSINTKLDDEEDCGMDIIKNKTETVTITNSVLDSILHEPSYHSFKKIAKTPENRQQILISSGISLRNNDKSNGSSFRPQNLNINGEHLLQSKQDSEKETLIKERLQGEDKHSSDKKKMEEHHKDLLGATVSDKLQISDNFSLRKLRSDWFEDESFMVDFCLSKQLGDSKCEKILEKGSPKTSCNGKEVLQNGFENAKTKRNDYNVDYQNILNIDISRNGGTMCKKIDHQGSRVEDNKNLFDGNYDNVANDVDKEYNDGGYDTSYQTLVNGDHKAKERDGRQPQEEETLLNGKNDSLLPMAMYVPVDLLLVRKQELEAIENARSKRGGQKRKRKKKKNSCIQKPGVRTESKPKPLCKYFLNGKCRQGANCQFLHEGTPRRKELCRYYVTDSCLADKCIFMHEEFPCKFYHTSFKCNNGDKCKYSHDPLTEETDQLLKKLLSREASVKKESEEATENFSELPKEETDEEKRRQSKLPNLYESLI